MAFTLMGFLLPYEHEVVTQQHTDVAAFHQRQPIKHNCSQHLPELKWLLT